MENKIQKLKEYTSGSHVYMKLELNSKIYEVDLYFRTDSAGNCIEIYETSADGTNMREEVIAAFNELY